MDQKQFKKEFVDTLQNSKHINAIVFSTLSDDHIFEYNKHDNEECFFDVSSNEKIEIYEKTNLFSRIFLHKKYRIKEKFSFLEKMKFGYHVFCGKKLIYSSYDASFQLKRYTKNGIISAIRNKLKKNKNVIVIFGQHLCMIEKN